MITVLLEPDGKELSLPNLNTARQLLNRLGLTQTEALVIREGELLTPDRPLKGGDTITIRTVGSRG
jgi:sulfur carrier protein